MDKRFEGKVAVISGGAGGIGRATAVRLATEGARVAVVDVSKSGLAVDSIGGTHSPVRTRAELDAAAARVRETAAR